MNIDGRRAAWLRLFLAGLSVNVSLFSNSTEATSTRRVFRAGAAVVDITPTGFPVVVNAMFTQRTAAGANDPLHARGLVLDDGTTRIALCVVDTCMLPRELIDHAKEMAR